MRVNRPITGKFGNYELAVFIDNSGSGGGTRTPDTRIMMPGVALKLRGFSVNRTPHAAILFRDLPRCCKPDADSWQLIHGEAKTAENCAGRAIETCNLSNRNQ